MDKNGRFEKKDIFQGKQLLNTKLLHKNLQLKISELMQLRSKLPLVTTKLKKGKPLQIGFLGGSITFSEGYRSIITDMLQAKYPQSKISGINGGIGGTGSSFGAFRLYKDILRYKPGLIFVEFAVNDCAISPEHSLAAMEGIVRQIKEFNLEIDICFIYTINQEMKKALERGEQYWTVTTMEKIAAHYNIASINLGPEVLAQEKSGKLIFQLPRNSEAEHIARQGGKLVFSYDSVHPTLDDGHGLYSKIIMTALEQLITINVPTNPAIPINTLSAHPWTKVNIFPLKAAELSGQWNLTTPQKENFQGIENIQRLNSLWKATEAGAEIRFRFKGSGFGLLGIFGLNSGQFKVWIDGVEHSKVSLFDKYSNLYRVHYTIINDSLSDKEHEVILQLDLNPPDRSMLLENRKIDDLKKLNGLVAYIDSLLVIG